MSKLNLHLPFKSIELIGFNTSSSKFTKAKYSSFIHKLINLRPIKAQVKQIMFDKINKNKHILLNRKKLEDTFLLSIKEVLDSGQFRPLLASTIKREKLAGSSTPDKPYFMFEHFYNTIQVKSIKIK